MKKIFAAMVILGLGVVVGCGADDTKKTTTGSSTATPSGTTATTHTSTAPATTK